MLLRIVKWLPKFPYRFLKLICLSFPYFKFVHETKNTQTPITFEHWLLQHVVGVNRGPYWPIHHSSTVTGWRNILIGIETSPGYMGGCYIQGIGKISIGDYTQIAANVGIVSANHQLTDNRKHDQSSVKIGSYCWLGFGSVVLPGVCLGDYTIVAAGAVVTKSFPNGHCVIGGSPARLIQDLDPHMCVRHESQHKYHGYVPHRDFEQFCKENLNLE